MYWEEETDVYNEQLRKELDEIVGNLSREARSRFELRVESKGQLARFESLEIQELATGAVTDWVLGLFGRGRTEVMQRTGAERA